MSVSASPASRRANRGLFSVNEEYAPLNRAACCDPSCTFGPVGMTRIFIDHADASGHLDLVALDSNGLGAILKKPAESAMGLKADQEHGGPVVPQPMFEMMANAAGVAHAACRDNDMKAGQFCESRAWPNASRSGSFRRQDSFSRCWTTFTSFRPLRPRLSTWRIVEGSRLRR
jgi:hypothetical protein